MLESLTVTAEEKKTAALVHTKRDKPDYCYDCNCPEAFKSRGFALGCGDIQNADLGALFERPAEEEISFTLETSDASKPKNISLETWKVVKKWREEEIARRKRAFPELPERFIMRGAPVRGMSGAEIEQWVFPIVGGLKLDGMVLENVLHCAAPNDKELYPKGAERLVAESCCAHWNQLFNYPERVSFNFDVDIVSLHPAGLLKETGGGIVALPIQISTFEKAKSFVKEGRKILVLAGGKASKFWLGYAEAVTRWAGHYQIETRGTWKRRIERIQEGLTMLANGAHLKRKKSTPASPEETLQKTAKRPKKPKKEKSPELSKLEMSLGNLTRSQKEPKSS